MNFKTLNFKINKIQIITYIAAKFQQTIDDINIFLCFFNFS